MLKRGSRPVVALPAGAAGRPGAAAASGIHGSQHEDADSDEDEDWDEEWADDDGELWDEDLSPPYGRPAILLAGWPTPEIAACRLLVDGIGGQDITVVPTTPQMLHVQLAEALQYAEPAWDQPLPASAVEGGGWGCVKMAVFSGLRCVGLL